MNILSVSIIIPAHNEAAVIEGTLSALLPEFTQNGKQIIVVCNACCDSTAEIVSGFNDVILIQTEKASKTHALNSGDAEASGDIRVYMDADVTMTAKHVIDMLKVLIDGNFLAVSPDVQMDCSGSSWLVRSYYKIWLQLPYVKEGFMGGGVYALSPEGRKRFECFPEIISDDGFIRGLFDKEEINRVDNAYSRVKAPKSLSGLIKIKTRSRLGHYQLLEKFPEMRSKHNKPYRKAIIGVLRKPTNWVWIAIYLGINFICRLRALIIHHNEKEYIWETDSSSRG